MDERRNSDKAVLQSHNDLLRQMRERATEAQRQLDRLTEGYATKENLATLESVIDGRLSAIEKILSSRDAGRQAVKSAWNETKTTILAGFVILGVLIALANYFSQQ